MRRKFFFGTFPVVKEKDFILKKKSFEENYPIQSQTYFDDCKDDLDRFFKFEKNVTEEKICIISGHFGAGKSCFSKFVEYEYEKKEFKTIWFSFNKEKHSNLEQLKESIYKMFCEKYSEIDTSTLSTFVDLMDSNDKLCIFIDEIELAYDNKNGKEFNDLLRSITRNFGQKVIGVGAEPQIYSNLLSSPFYGNNFYIAYYKKQKVEELVNEYNEENPKYSLSQNFIDCLYSVTDGHKGYCGKILSTITEVSHFQEEEKNKQKSGDQGYTWSMYIQRFCEKKEKFIDIAQGTRMFKTILGFFEEECNINGEKIPGSVVARKFPFIYAGGNIKDIENRGKAQNDVLKLGIKYGLIRRKNGDDDVVSTCWLTRTLFYRECSHRFHSQIEITFKDSLLDAIVKILPYLNKNSLKCEETHLSNAFCPKESVFHCQFYSLLKKVKDEDYKKINLLTEANVMKLLPPSLSIDSLKKKAELLYTDVKFRKSNEIDLVLQRGTESELSENYVIELVSGAGTNKTSVKYHWARNECIYSKIKNTKKHVVVSFHHCDLEKNKPYYPEKLGNGNLIYVWSTDKFETIKYSTDGLKTVFEIELGSEMKRDAELEDKPKSVGNKTFEFLFVDDSSMKVTVNKDMTYQGLLQNELKIKDTTNLEFVSNDHKRRLVSIESVLKEENESLLFVCEKVVPKRKRGKEVIDMSDVFEINGQKLRKYRKVKNDNDDIVMEDKKEYEKWTKEEVRDWINGLDTSFPTKRYGEMFLEAEIHGGVIKYVTKAELKELGIKMGDALHIDKEIKNL